MPPLSLSERNPFGLVVTPSSGSSLLGTAGPTRDGRKWTPHPAQVLEGRPGPLVGSLGDHILIAERPAALRAPCHELEGVLFRKIVRAGDQEMVADLALLVRLPKLRVALGESRQRRRVLGAQRTVHRLPDRNYGVEERIILPERGFHVEGWHRLVERGADYSPVPVQDSQGLRQYLLVDLDGTRRAGGVGQGGETCYPVQLCLRVPRTERVGPERIGVARLHETRGRMLGQPEVTGLWFAAGEAHAYYPRRLQELVLRQFRREDRGVAAAAVRSGPREIHERQGLRQGLYPVVGDICGFRISTVGQGVRFVGSLPLSLHLL